MKIGYVVQFSPGLPGISPLLDEHQHSSTVSSHREAQQRADELRQRWPLAAIVIREVQYHVH